MHFPSVNSYPLNAFWVPKAIVILGAIILIRNTSPDNYMVLTLASIALSVGSINVFGGFFVTNRMLSMFNKKNKK